jgi:hypothetical protein
MVNWAAERVSLFGILCFCNVTHTHTQRETERFTPPRMQHNSFQSHLFWNETPHHLPTRSFISASRKPSMFSIAFHLFVAIEVVTDTRQRIQKNKKVRKRSAFEQSCEAGREEATRTFKKKAHAPKRRHEV